MVTKFRALGWAGPIRGSKHPFMVKGKQKQRIPNPHDDPIHVSLLKEILRQADVKNEEWEQA